MNIHCAHWLLLLLQVCSWWHSPCSIKTGLAVCRGCHLWLQCQVYCLACCSQTGQYARENDALIPPRPVIEYSSVATVTVVRFVACLLAAIKQNNFQPGCVMLCSHVHVPSLLHSWLPPSRSVCKSLDAFCEVSMQRPGCFLWGQYAKPWLLSVRSVCRALAAFCEVSMQSPGCFLWGQYANAWLLSVRWVCRALAAFREMSMQSTGCFLWGEYAEPWMLSVSLVCCCSQADRYSRLLYNSTYSCYNIPHDKLVDYRTPVTCHMTGDCWLQYSCTQGDVPWPGCQD